MRRLYPRRSPPYSSPSPYTPSPVNRLIVVLIRLSSSPVVKLSSPTPSSLYLYRRVYFLFPPPSVAPHCHHRCYRPSPIARRLSPPPSFFSLTRAMFDCCVVSSSYPSPHRKIALPPTSSLPPPPPPTHSHRAVHRPLSLQPAR